LVDRSTKYDLISAAAFSGTAKRKKRPTREQKTQKSGRKKKSPKRKKSP